MNQMKEIKPESSPINLPGVTETLMIPLLARAKESMTAEPLFVDNFAIRVLNNSDYDFEKIEGKEDKYTLIGAVIRTHIIDSYVIEFLKENPNALVLNIGAGLDARFERVDTGKLLWYDFDLPEVIELRKSLALQNDRRIPSDKSIFEPTTFGEIPLNNRPILVIAEGLFPYFEEQQIKQFFANIVSRFGSARIIFDCVGEFVAKRYKKTHPTLKKMKNKVLIKFGFSNASKLKVLHPQLTLMKELDYYDAKYKSHWGFLGNLMGKIPFFRKQFKIWYCEFK